jgi:hypothetical protein
MIGFILLIILIYYLLELLIIEILLVKFYNRKHLYFIEPYVVFYNYIQDNKVSFRLLS